LSVYTAKIEWRRQADEPFTDGKYHRAHSWAFDGGHVVPASSSPHVVRVPWSDPAGVDPEEALVAALSSCHMLFVLDYARQAGFLVESYVDDAEGTMAKGADGRIQMTRVKLGPHIVFAGARRPTQGEVDVVHARAHEACYIANSVKAEIVIAGTNEGLDTTIAPVMATRDFAAPRTKVFAAWGDAETVKRWFSPEGFSVPTAHVDFRVGGVFSLEMQGPPGMSSQTDTVFSELSPPDRLRFAGTVRAAGQDLFRVDTRVEFLDHGRGTRVVVAQSYDPISPWAAGAIAGAPVGWAMTLEKLARVVEGA